MYLWKRDLIVDVSYLKQIFDIINICTLAG